MHSRKGQAQTLNEDQQLLVLSTIKHRSRFPERDQAIFVLSVYAGLRIGEIAQLDLSDVLDTDSSRIVVKPVITMEKTKGGKPREVYLSNPTVRKALERHIEVNFNIPHSDAQKKTALFLGSKSNQRFSNVTMSQLFKRFYQQWCSIDRASGHSGRRTFITTLANEGINLKHLSVLAGHNSVQTTALYIDNNPHLLAKIAEKAISSRAARNIR